MLPADARHDVAAPDGVRERRRELRRHEVAAYGAPGAAERAAVARVRGDHGRRLSERDFAGRSGRVDAGRRRERERKLLIDVGATGRAELDRPASSVPGDSPAERRAAEDRRRSAKSARIARAIWRLTRSASIASEAPTSHTATPTTASVARSRAVFVHAITAPTARDARAQT
jgi:hypothetical protein